MSVILPGSVASASGWALVDYLTARVRSEPAAGGVATAVLPQLDPDEMWLIDHAVVWCDSATPTSARWYESVAIPEQLLDGTSRGAFDVADWPAGLLLRPSQHLIVQWDGASDGARGVVTVQYRVFRR